MHKPEKAYRRIAAAIRSYLDANPGAADSELGIADWWVGGSGLTASREDVRAALDYLEAEKVIRSQTLADGRVLYRAASPGDRPVH